MLTLATVAKVAGANLVAQLAFFPAGQLLVLLGRRAPVVHGVEGVYLYDRANLDLFLDATRMNDRLAILAFIMSNWGRSDRTIFILVLVLLMILLIFYSIVITKVTWNLGSRSGHELRVDGKWWRESTRGAGSARVRAIVGECENIQRRASDGLSDGGFGVEYIVGDVGKVEPKIVVEV
jgi:hypothetical protein